MSEIRLGLVVDSNMVPAWADRMLDAVMSESLASIAFVVRVDTDERATAQPADAGLLSRCLKRFERFLIGSQPLSEDPLGQVELGRVRATTISVDEAVTFCSEKSDTAPLACDMLVTLVESELPAELFDCARLGVWDIVVGSSRTNLSEIAGHYEVLTSQAVTESFLRRRRTQDDAGVILYSSTSCTESMSVAANIIPNYWKAAFYIPRILAALQLNPDALLEYRQPAPDLSVRKVSNIRYAAMLVCKFAEKLRRKFGDVFFKQQWILAMRYSQDLPDRFSDFTKLIPPQDRFWADPFLFEYKGKSYLFFEELQYRTNRGEILAVEIDENGFVGKPVTAMAKDFHLSYPFVFEFEGEVYMIPESYDNRTVDLYRSTGFPDAWQLERTLFSGQRFVDVTIHKYNETYWLFANVSSIDAVSPWDELYLFYADSPVAEEWTSHPENPVVSDVRTSRPAGRVFSHKDKLIRPSQNCAPHYGYGLNFCEIIELTKTRYREQVWKRFEPVEDRSVVSLHTYNEMNGIQVTDFQHRVRKSG
ncbi:MAG: hypothetical protein K0U72_15180 [Gammaproteobacteria bacterium]|nr:hypothetical protein [Gammaproteobacteria bacterium]